MMRSPTALVGRLLATAVLLVFSLGPWQSAWSADSPKVILHGVAAQPAESALEYVVSVLFSYVGSDGRPRPVSEDRIEILLDGEAGYEHELTPYEGTTSIALLIDVSGSMAGAPIENAKNAVRAFLEEIPPGYSVSLVTFEEEIVIETEFSSDGVLLTQAASGISAVRGAGTCLWDALHRTTTRLAGTPNTRRAIIVVTDAIDETRSGAGCSAVTVDDVAEAATKPSLWTTVMAVLVGDREGRHDLERLSVLTAGLFASVPSGEAFSRDVALFRDVLDAVQGVRFVTSVPPGIHQVSVGVVGASAEKTSATIPVQLAPIPPDISVSAPESPLSGSDVVPVAVRGQSAVSRVEFRVGGKTIYRISDPPWDFPVSALSGPGSHAVTVIAFDSAGESSTAEFQVAVEEAPLVATQALVEPTPTTVPAGPPAESELEEEEPPAPETGTGRPVPMLAYVGLGTALLALAVAAVAGGIWLKDRRGQEKEEERTLEELLRGLGGSGPGGTVKKGTVKRGTAGAASAEYGRLLIRKGESSPARASFEIRSPRITLGRDDECDLSFDNPHVSGIHAELEYREGSLFVRELPDRPSTNGTSVNGRRIHSTPKQLQPGDIISLADEIELEVAPPRGRRDTRRRGEDPAANQEDPRRTRRGST